MTNNNLLPFLSLLIMLLLAGCDSKAEAEPAAVIEPTNTAPTAIPSATQITEATATPVPIPDTPTAVPNTPVPIPPTDTPPPTEIPSTTTPVVTAAKPQLLEFYTEWWPTCQQMKPIVNGLKKAYVGQVKVSRIDREDPENAEIVQQYGARNQPMYFMLDSDGEII